MKDERLDRALYFDRRQAWAIKDFLHSQLLRTETTGFRLMPDVFPGCLDITSYDAKDEEITHIHPRSEEFLKRSPA